jgi:imidazolonepropionase-like amidohydrolase
MTHTIQHALPCLMSVTVLALLIAACRSAAAPLETPSPRSMYAITDVAVVDVEQGTVIPDQTVIIEGESIRAVGPRVEVAVRHQAEAGVDQIKVYSKLDKDVFLAIVDEARKVGLKVVGHVPDSIEIEEAAVAGLESSEHLFGFDKVVARLLGAYVRQTYAGMGAEAGYLQRLDEVDPTELQAVYQQLRASGLTVCPTVIVFKTGTQYKAIQSGDFQGSEYISPFMQGIWQSQWAQQDDLPDFVWQNWAQMVKGLHDAGVPLMVGTDLTTPGIIPGEAVHQEMEIWQDAGIPPVDVRAAPRWRQRASWAWTIVLARWRRARPLLSCW